MFGVYLFCGRDVCDYCGRYWKLLVGIVFSVGSFCKCIWFLVWFLYVWICYVYVFFFLNGFYVVFIFFYFLILDFICFFKWGDNIIIIIIFIIDEGME